MDGIGFDPRRRAAQLTWRNRIGHWRAQPGESAFHLAALLTLAVLLALLIGSQRASFAALLAWLVGNHASALALLLLAACASDHVAALRRRVEREQRDWLAAQPVPRRVSRRRHAAAVLWRAGVHVLLVVSVSVFARVESADLALACVVAVVAIGFAPLATLRVAPAAPQATRRETPFGSGARASFARWQWIEAGASLAPRRLALLLPVILLVPRGKLLMAFVALALVALATAASAWQRMLGVFAQAQRWLEPQPVAAATWLRACLVAPLLLLLSVCAVMAAIASALGALPLAWLFALALPMLATLQLGAAACERRSTWRANLLALLHVVVLGTVAQALPPLAIPAWMLQLLWLARRSRHA